ncbi:MAG TPA: hypothetical protein VNI02_13035 [Blastocatellia bacterium]|jgi:hypothetical protein|nr:hypothetical protein [Blastocatellia bacterium]
MKKTIALLLLAALPIIAEAQDPSLSQRAEMKKLDFLLGQWQGEGWIVLGKGERRTFKQTETVQSKLDGLLIVVDGLGKGKIPGKQEEVVVHNAFAVASYDNGAKTFRWRAYRADGFTLDTDASVGENSLAWGFRSPQGGDIRFTIRLTEKDQWHEVGEYSQDGKSWNKFFEMTLQRVK